MVNRKIKNATVVQYDGITFRSKLEVKVYMALKDAGYEPEYEVEKITLLPSFRPTVRWYIDGEAQATKKGLNKTVIAKTYTPDFRLRLDGVTVYIEAKGKPNDAYPVTRKLFLSWLTRQKENIIFAEIHSLRGLHEFLTQLKTINEERI